MINSTLKEFRLHFAILFMFFVVIFYFVDKQIQSHFLNNLPARFKKVAIHMPSVKSGQLWPSLAELSDAAGTCWPKAGRSLPGFGSAGRIRPFRPVDSSALHFYQQNGDSETRNGFISPK